MTKEELIDQLLKEFGEREGLSDFKLRQSKKAYKLRKRLQNLSIVQLKLLSNDNNNR